MGLVDISPPAILPPRVVRFTREQAKSDGGSSTDKHLPGGTEAALPLTPQRLELIKACAENALRSGESMTASRIAQRFAPRASGVQPQAKRRPVAQIPRVPSFAPLAAAMRRLTVLLILTTLLPNLTLAALWLGLVAAPWSRPAVSPTDAGVRPAVEAPPPQPVLTAPAAIEATAGGVIALPIALDGTDGIPPDSRILIKGLPPGSVLSSGQAYGATEWSLKPGDIGDLRLAIPETGTGAAALRIELAAPGNRVVADASTLLNVTALPTPSVEEKAVTGALDPQTLEAVADDQEMTAALAAVDPDAPPLPDRRPASPTGGDTAGEWVRPSAYVNLRQAPSSSASVVGVVAKGVKLRVTARKRGWVQVSNPASSQAGWIYSGNVATAQ